MTNEVIRDNDTVHTSTVDVFEFDQQGAFLVQQKPYEVQPGDSFRTSCYYRDGAKFGLSSQAEMCIAYIMYYPARDFEERPWMCPYGLEIPMCSQELDRFDLQDEQGLDRVFGSANGLCVVEVEGSSNGETSSSGRVGASVISFISLLGSPLLLFAFCL